MICSICGAKMRKIKTDRGVIDIVKKLGLTFQGTWRCPNSGINHKRRYDTQKNHPQA